MTSKISILAIDLAKGSFQVCAVGPDGAVVFSLPNARSATLPVAWFADDLRAGVCTLRPGVEAWDKVTAPITWSVNGVARAHAHLVSRDQQERPVCGGTPADFSVVQAIRELRSRGLRVTLSPFLLMDVPPGNMRPNPYSDAAGETGQPACPWRGRITCSPAAGFAGTVDKTAAAAAQVAAFFGSASPSEFAITGEAVSWTGATDDWGLRRMVLHYAHLCAAAGGVDTFLIASGLRGLTQIRSDAGTYPGVQALRALTADVRTILGPGTQISYAAHWSEYSGHQPQDGSGDVHFHLDPLWADPEIDFIGIDNFMPLSDWRDGDAHVDAALWPAIHDRAYLQSNIAGGEGFDWLYASDADRSAQRRTPITDTTAGKPWVFRPKDLHSWWSNPHYDRPGGVESAVPTAWVPQSRPIRFTALGCPAIDRGTNQPDEILDPAASEYAMPYFSRGWRDDAIQRAYLEATLDYWSRAGTTPVSAIHGAPMIRLEDCAAFTWDARPYPAFPELQDAWPDSTDWNLGPWLTGRLGSNGLQSLVRALCLRAGLPSDRIDVSGLSGSVEGYVITALESARASITSLARFYGFDASETEGVLRFVMRGRNPVATITPDNMVASDSGAGELFELTRAQETDLPHALKWQVASSSEDYDTALVEAQRITVDTARISAESFPFAVPLEEADRQCRRALMETWVGRESATFRLPPSRLAIEPGDALRLQHDGRLLDLRVLSVADNVARDLSAMAQDLAIYGVPRAQPRPATLTRPVVFGATQAIFLDLPQLVDQEAAHQPLIGAYARPWPGPIAVWRSAAEDGFELVETFGTRARIGRLTASLAAGHTSRFDMANQLLVSLQGGTIDSVTDLALFAGDNALAIETAPDIWEIVQAGGADLVGPGEYRLTRLLRGQRGTEAAMMASVPAGARVVMLDAALARLSIAQADLGLPWTWRIGPAARPFTDDSYAAAVFTPQGTGLRPFAVAHVAQPWRQGRVPGDLTIRWTRRDRALVSDSWQAVEVPMSETSEAYEVEILDGDVVARVLATPTNSVVYSALEQTVDRGALLGPGDTLAIRICQLSALVGRGAARTLTLTF